MKMHSTVSHGFWSWPLAVDWVIWVWAQKHCKMDVLKMPLNTSNKVRWFSSHKTCMILDSFNMKLRIILNLYVH